MSDRAFSVILETKSSKGHDHGWVYAEQVLQYCQEENVIFEDQKLQKFPLLSLLSSLLLLLLLSLSLL